MNLGKILKDIRKNLGLTQKEMVGSILSVAQYSRIESGSQDMKVNDLLKIIQLHHLDKEYVFDRIIAASEAKSTIDYNEVFLEEDIIRAFYDQDCSLAKLLNSEAKEKFNSDDLTNRTEILVDLLDGKDMQSNERLKQRILQHVMKSEEWIDDPRSLRLFAFSTSLFSADELFVFLNMILNHYRKVENITFLQQKYISIICISYLKNSTDIKPEDTDKRPISWLAELPAIPEFLMYKLLGNYYEAAINHQDQQMEEIRNIFSLSGYDKFINNIL